MKQDAYDTFVTIAFFLWILTPLGILGWQIYGYLRYAVWNSLSVIDSLRWLGSEWASNPTDWTGLYSVLEWTPLVGDRPKLTHWVRFKRFSTATRQSFAYSDPPTAEK